MKLINLILLFLPFTGFSQVDTMTMNGYSCFGCDSTEFVIGYNKFITGDTLLTYGGITTQSFDYYNGTLWLGGNWSTELHKGQIETPVNIMDSGMKVEVVETRDTIYKCPYSNFTYFTSDGSTSNENKPRSGNCKLDKIVTTRRYKLYVINEYGQKEYLSMELTKQK